MGDDMKITQLGAAAAVGAVLASGFQVGWVALAHADSGYTITLNGQNIAHGDAATVTCMPQRPTTNVTIHAGGRNSGENGGQASLGPSYGVDQGPNVQIYQYTN